MAANILRNRMTIFHPPPTSIIWFYREGVHQPLYKQMKDEQWVDEFHAISSENNFEQIKEIVEALPLTENKICIYDDLMSDVSKSSSEIFTNLGHHRNMTNLFISQSIFMNNENLRIMSKNCHYEFFCRHVRSKAQLRTWARQTDPALSKMICQIFDDALKDPFSHLLCASHPKDTNIQQMIRFRRYNFPNTDVITVYLTK